VGNSGKEICPDMNAAESTQMLVTTYPKCKSHIAKECAVEQFRNLICNPNLTYSVPCHTKHRIYCFIRKKALTIMDQCN
jgi:hypothetical protein